MNVHLMKKAQGGLFLTLSLLVVFSFLLAACGPAATTEAPAPTQAATEESPTEAAAPTATEEPKPLPPLPSSSTNHPGWRASKRWSTNMWKRPATKSI